MKRPSLCFQIFLILAAQLFFSAVHAQQVFKTTSKSVIGYLEYLPQGYNSNDNKYPIVIFLHGKGEKGPDGKSVSTLKTGVDKLTKLGPPYHVKNGKQFPFILISPQLKKSYSDWPSSYVMEVIDHVKKYLRIDESRIYLTGLSLGGGAAWVTAQDYPGVFAAVAPVCGSWNIVKKACGFAENKTGVWAFHGDKDTTIPLSRTLNMITAINNCSPRPDPKAKVTVYPGMKHDVWNKAYAPDHSVHSQNVYEWMLTFRKSGGSTTKPASPAAPEISAGVDQEIKLPTTSLKIVATVEGETESYGWSQVGGNKASLSGSSSRTATISGLKEGAYKFRFSAKYYDKDKKLKEKYDEVLVTVKTSGNSKPVVSAGSDKSLTLPDNHVVLQGKATDQDKDPLRYQWKQREGGGVKMSGAQTANLDIDDLKAGNYRFRLTVKDNHGGESYDEVTITVNAGSNAKPTVSAGSDKQLTLPENRVVLSGKASDADKDQLTYYWKQQQGGGVTMKGASTPNLDVSKLKEGTYRFRLTVKDRKGGEAYDEATIIVKAASGNKAPVANAGSDKNLTLPSNRVVLQGNGSDANKDPLTYFWKQQQGGGVTMKGAHTATLDVSDLKAGTYRFRLTVKDNHGAQHYDEATIVVQAASNYAPVASAGSDKKVTLPDKRVILWGSGSDRDKDPLTYFWKQQEGAGVIMKGAHTSRLDVDGLKAGNYRFRLTVKDNHGHSHYDEVNIIVSKSGSTASAAGREVNDASTNARSVESEGNVMNTEVAVSETKEVETVSLSASNIPELSNPDESEWSRYNVLVYNDRGERLYSGQWNRDAYGEVMTNRGLYVYVVQQGQQRIKSGKIFVTQ